MNECSLRGIAGISAPTVGFGVTEEGAVFSTSDGGNGWVRAGRVSLTEAHAVHFVDANKGFEACIFQTHPQATRWGGPVPGPG